MPKHMSLPQRCNLPLPTSRPPSLLQIAQAPPAAPPPSFPCPVPAPRRATAGTIAALDVVWWKMAPSTTPTTVNDGTFEETDLFTCSVVSGGIHSCVHVYMSGFKHTSHSFPNPRSKRSLQFLPFEQFPFHPISSHFLILSSLLLLLPQHFASIVLFFFPFTKKKKARTPSVTLSAYPQKDQKKRRSSNVECSTNE